MDQGKFLSGVFSVYNSAEAGSFAQSERYPIGFEAIFRNDVAGMGFTHRLEQSMRLLCPEKAVIILKGEVDDSLREAACFFRDVDTFRQFLQGNAFRDQPLPRGARCAAKVYAN
jgi:hypothetical protein